MKAIAFVLGAICLTAAIGCDNKSNPPAKKGTDIDIQAGPAGVKVDDGKIKVDAPNTNIEVDRKDPPKN
jgi:hypothetical protein